MEKIKIYKFNDILNLTIKNKTILLFEPNSFHYECSPGYAKYFIDLGYNVDILMHISGIDAFEYFENKDKIRLFIYNELEQINSYSKIFRSQFSVYSYIVIQTISTYSININSNLGLLNNDKVIYVFHFTYYYEIHHFSAIKNQNRIWTLGHFPIGLQVVPFYAGKFKLRNKNRKTRFFVVSTIYRNYNYLVSASEKLKNDNLDFEVFVVGKVKQFSLKNINEKIRDNFIFNYKVNFKLLYKIIYYSDFIIITLDPDNKHDNIFKNKKVTGAAQLSLGFLKPVLINKYFLQNYDISQSNCLIYDKTNFYDVMKKAILLNNKDYKEMQMNLNRLVDKIKFKSIINIKKTLYSISNQIFI